MWAASSSSADSMDPLLSKSKEDRAVARSRGRARKSNDGADCTRSKDVSDVRHRLQARHFAVSPRQSLELDGAHNLPAQTCNSRQSVVVSTNIKTICVRCIGSQKKRRVHHTAVRSFSASSHNGHTWQGRPEVHHSTQIIQNINKTYTALDFSPIGLSCIPGLT